MEKVKSVKKIALTSLLITSMLFSLGTFTGCSAQNTSGNSSGIEQKEPNQDQSSEKKTGFLETTLDLIQDKDQLTLAFSLKNTSSKDLTLIFGSGHKYDIVVTDAKGNVVFDWAKDKAFIEALLEETLGPDQSISFSEKWDYTDQATGNRVPAGKYTVTVKIRASSDGTELTAEELTAAQEIEIQ